MRTGPRKPRLRSHVRPVLRRSSGSKSRARRSGKSASFAHPAITAERSARAPRYLSRRLNYPREPQIPANLWLGVSRSNKESCKRRLRRARTACLFLRRFYRAAIARLDKAAFISKPALTITINNYIPDDDIFHPDTPSSLQITYARTFFPLFFFIFYCLDRAT
jgi:hypothetical protein